MLRVRLGIVFASLLFLVACKKSDPSPASAVASPTYFILTSEDAPATGGAIVTYDFNNNVVKTNAYASSAMSDILLDDGKIYGVYRDSKTVDVLDAKTMTRIKSISYGSENPFQPFRGKHIAIANGKLFVAHFANPPAISGNSYCYLKAINLANPTQVDSITVAANSIILDLIAVGNKLFVSIYPYSIGSSVSVIDASNYSLLKNIPLTTPCGKLLADDSNNVLAFQNVKTSRINATDYSLTNVPVLASTFFNLGSAGLPTGVPAAFGDTSNTLYFLGLAAQPASAPYVLLSFDAPSGATKNVTTAFISASTMTYDKKNAVIVIGENVFTTQPVKGAVTFYNTDGTSPRKISTPMAPLKILIAQ